VGSVDPPPGGGNPLNMSAMEAIVSAATPTSRSHEDPAQDAPARIPLEEVYMRMAEELAKRSTCARNQIGSVITTGDLTQVLGIGYNGNARGLPNSCDSSEPGRCGCLHSEANALIKAGAQVEGKLMFVTASPCVMCAKMIINSNVRRVYYRTAYRDPAGVEVLRQGGVEAQLYDRWRDLWR
jgi:dCMP deaminase